MQLQSGSEAWCHDTARLHDQLLNRSPRPRDAGEQAGRTGSCCGQPCPTSLDGFIKLQSLDETTKRLQLTTARVTTLVSPTTTGHFSQTRMNRQKTAPASLDHILCVNTTSDRPAGIQLVRSKHGAEHTLH